MRLPRGFVPAARFIIAIANCAFLAPTVKSQTTFTNNNPITILSDGQETGIANPYPSSITVAGYTGNVTAITVTLTGFSHTWANDLAAVVTGPGGQKTILFGGPGLDINPGTSVTNLTLVFDDTAAETLPVNANFGSGTYRPGLNQYNDTLRSPAPPPPYATDFSAFLGQPPDGTYSLYVQDYFDGEDGLIQSWSITLHGITPVPEPTTVLAGPAVLIALTGLVHRLRRGWSEAAPQG